MSIENPFEAARRKRSKGSPVFFGESQSGVRYEWTGKSKGRTGAREGTVAGIAGSESADRKLSEWLMSDDDDDAGGRSLGGGLGGGGPVGASGRKENNSSFGDLHENNIDTSSGKFVKQYILGEKLGEGAYAKVKEGMDARTLRIVAVKIIEKRHVARIRGGMDNVRREIAIMKSMKKHPNVIELVEVIDEPSAPRIYVVMELANGCSLQDLINKNSDNRIPVEQTRLYFRQLCLGLKHLHGKNIVHRDIKPANLMLTTEHELKISDFGVAEFLDKYNASDGVTSSSGSPAFQAPEIAKGDYIFSGMAVDLWAAGVTLYYLLVGRVPFADDNIVRLFAKISEGRYEVPSFLDGDARDLISQLLQSDATKRPSAAEALKHPWLQDRSSKKESSKYIPVRLREVHVVRLVSGAYDERDGGSEEDSVAALAGPDVRRSRGGRAGATEPATTLTTGQRPSAAVRAYVQHVWAAVDRRYVRVREWLLDVATSLRRTAGCAIM